MRGTRLGAGLGGLVAGAAMIAAAASSHAAATLTVSIESGPSGSVPLGSATFAFAASAPARLQCRLDGLPIEACASPVTYTNLAGGPHTFTVFASTVGAGPPERAQAGRTWTVGPGPARLPALIANLGTGDDDGDRIPGAADGCPSTPRGLKPLARGCAAVEIVAAPQLFTDPASTALRRAFDWYRSRDPLLQAIMRRLRSAGRSYDAARRLMERGRACPAAEAFTGGLSSMRAVGKLLPAVQSALTARFLRTIGSEDASSEVEGLTIGRALLGNAFARARLGSAAFTAVCHDVVHPLHYHGLVRSFDSAHHLVLVGKHWFELPLVRSRRSKSNPYLGSHASLTGVQFKDGSGVVSTVTSVPSISKVPGVLKVACAIAEIAPVQTFQAPIPNYKTVLQDIRGYESGGKLWLEQGMRLANKTVCSAPPGIQPAISHKVFSVKLTLAYKNTSGQQTAATLSDALMQGDPPVALPADIDPSATGTLTVTEQTQICQIAFVGHPNCSAPVADGTVQSYKAWIKPTGSYATANYSKTEFDLEGQPQGTFVSAAVNSITLHSGAAGTNAAFNGAGYTVTGGVSSRPTVKTIATGKSFAVYLDDFFANDLLYGQDLTGVDHPAGLEWPRAEGTRNGHPFWYIATVPQLQKDLLGTCNSPGLPDAFFKLPWDPDLPGWKLFTGNFDDPGGGHANSPVDANGDPYDNNQKFAYDFAMDANNNRIGESGQDIRAARDGVVYALQNNQKGNSWASGATEENIKYAGPHPAGYTGVGNFVVIELQDGRMSSYWHLAYHGVHVGVGDHVTRGEVIATSDDTGNSSTPHMHFDARSGWDLGYLQNHVEFPSTPVTFEDKNHTCWIPRDADQLASDNYGG